MSITKVVLATLAKGSLGRLPTSLLTAISAPAIAFFIGVSVGYYFRDLIADREALKSLQEGVKISNEVYENDIELAIDSINLEKEIVDEYKKIIEESKQIKINDCDVVSYDFVRLYNESIKKIK